MDTQECCNGFNASGKLATPQYSKDMEEGTKFGDGAKYNPNTKNTMGDRNEGTGLRAALRRLDYFCLAWLRDDKGSE